MKKIFILLLLIITSCGYQPIYKINQNIDTLKIKEIKLSGDQTLSEKISKELSIEIIKNNESLNKLGVDSQKNITETSKNSKGQVTSYRTTISTIISIIDGDGNIIRKKNVSKQFSYNVLANKFKLKEYQEEIENNLINQIIRDINIFLNF
jgi:outer membrane lipopolysaccharide assembly protein LptE/RlpB